MGLAKTESNAGCWGTVFIFAAIAAWICYALLRPQPPDYRPVVRVIDPKSLPSSLPAEHPVRINQEAVQRDMLERTRVRREVAAWSKCAEYAGEYGNRSHWEWEITADLGDGLYEVSWIYWERDYMEGGNSKKTTTLFTCTIQDGVPVGLKKEKEWK